MGRMYKPAELLFRLENVDLSNISDQTMFLLRDERYRYTSDVSVDEAPPWKSLLNIDSIFPVNSFLTMGSPSLTPISCASGFGMGCSMPRPAAAH